MRARIVVQALVMAMLAWLYGGDLVRAAQLARAPMAAMTAAPDVVLATLGLAVAVLGVVAFIKARARVAFAIGAALVLMYDFGVRSSGRSPRSVDELEAAAVASLTEQAQALAGSAGVPRDPAQLGRVGLALGAPPFFLAGAQRRAWALEVQRRCAGPVFEPGDRLPGTLIYCVAADGLRAWVTAVTLDDTFGVPRVRRAIVGVVSAPAADPTPPMWERDVP